MCNAGQAIDALIGSSNHGALKLYLLAVRRGAQQGVCPHGRATRTLEAPWRGVQGMTGLGRAAQESAREFLASEGWLLDRRGANDALEGLTVLLERCAACAADEGRAALERQRRREEARAARMARRAELARDVHVHVHSTETETENVHVQDVQQYSRVRDDDWTTPASVTCTHEELGRMERELRAAGVHNPRDWLSKTAAKRVRFTLWWREVSVAHGLKPAGGVLVQLLKGQGPLPLPPITDPVPSSPVTIVSGTSAVPDAPSNEAEALWRRVLEGVRREVPASAYATWFDDSAGVRLEGGRLTVAVRSELQARELQRYTSILDRLAGAEVVFVEGKVAAER